MWQCQDSGPGLTDIKAPGPDTILILSTDHSHIKLILKLFCEDRPKCTVYEALPVLATLLFSCGTHKATDAWFLCIVFQVTVTSKLYVHYLMPKMFGHNGRLYQFKTLRFFGLFFSSELLILQLAKGAFILLGCSNKCKEVNCLKSTCHQLLLNIMLLTSGPRSTNS